MPPVMWIPNADGDWDTTSNWSNGVLPASADNVVISTVTKHTITHSQGSDSAANLTVGNDLLAMTGGSLTIVNAVALANGFYMTGGVANLGTSTTVTGTLTQTGGNLSIGGTLTVEGQVSLSGGVANLGTSTTITGSLNQTGGNLSVGGTLTVMQGGAQLQGGALVASTILQVATGPMILSSYTIAGQAQIQNTSVIYQTGNITIGDSSGVGALIATAAGASYDFANAVSVGRGAATAQITNAGTLATLAGAGASTVNVSVASTGVIAAAAGSGLTLAGPVDTLSGTITGAGTFSVVGGTTTLAGGTAIDVGTFSVINNGTNLALGGNLTIAGGFSDSTGTTLALAGHTLTLTGNAVFQQNSQTPLITGAGALVTRGTTSLSGTAAALALGSTVAWNNYGTVNALQGVQVGTSASGTASIVNEAGGLFNLAAAGIAILNGSNPLSTLTNAGTVAMIANGGTDYLQVAVTSNKLISSAVSDNLEFDAKTNTIGGTVTGSGQVSFASAGTTTLSANTKISVGTLALYTNGTNLATAGNVTDSGLYAQSDGTTLALGTGTFTLTGPARFQQTNNGVPLVNGTGTLVTKGTTTLLGGSPLVVGGAAAWVNNGIVDEQGSLRIGDNNLSSASLTNAVGATLLFDASNVRISESSTSATLVNAGTLKATSSGVTGFDDVATSSTGTVLASQGTNIVFDASTGGSFSGVLTGAGQVSFAAGTNVVAAGTTLGSGTLSLYGAGTALSLLGTETISSALSISNSSTLSLGAAATVSGTLTEQDNSVIALGVNNLTLTGAAAFHQNSNAIPDVTGSGTLLTQGTTSLVGTGTALEIGGSVTWRNAGTVLANTTVQIGDSNASSASFTNAVGASVLFGGNGARIASGSASATLVNAGTLEVLTSGLTGFDDVATSSSGKILPSQGANLVFDASTTDSFSGMLTGAGQISFAGGGSDMIAAGTALSAREFAVYNNGTTLSLLGTETISSTVSLANASTLTLAGATSISGTFQEQDNSVVALGASTLTLAGPAVFFQNSNLAPDIRGAGNLITQGTTSLVGTGTALVIGGSATWSNTGTVFANTSLLIGDTNGLSATVVNAAGAVFDLLANGVTIVNGTTPYSNLVNAGLLEMAANGGTAFVRTASSSTGTILVLQGDNLEFDNPSTSFAGTISGAGQLSVGSGTGTLAGGTVITIATLAEYNNGTGLVLGGDVTDSGGYYQASASTLTLAGHTLTLAGNAQFQQNNGSPLVTGPGTLVTDGVTTLNGGGTALVVGGTAAWDNYGTVLDYNGLQIGNSPSVAASVVNEAGATLDLIASVGITSNSTPVSSFTNAGLFEMTAFGGTSSLNDNFTNTGTVLAQGGRMNFLGPVSGSGTLDISAGGALGFNSTVAAAATVDLLDATGSLFLTLMTPTAFAAKISDFAQGDRIDLANISFTNTTPTFAKGTGVLTFTDNNTHAVDATLHFTNMPIFTYANDGAGGILISDPSK